MSKSEILYVKGLNDSESDGEEDVWDDKKLNDAYDRAVRIANEEVAKRIAMSTNSSGEKEDKKGKKGKSKQGTKKSNEWKSGQSCRAVYDGDGLEYEAVVLRIINDKECIVKFIGYNNSEIVPLGALKPSLGNEIRTQQIAQALSEKADDGFGSLSPDPDSMELGQDRVLSPGSAERPLQNKKATKKKKNPNQPKEMNFELPELPLPMPNISMLRNLPMDMPMPPPPIAFPSQDRSDSEEQAISSMLLSWYMSGYYTGLYQGMKRAKENRNNN